jgi:tetratricopeptide (TPR) repeat protein
VETVAREITVLSRLARLLLVAMFLVLGTPRDVWSDEVSDAFDKLRQADEMWREGRLAMAQKGYEELLSRYPTWWLPMLKMAVLAMDMGLQEEALALLRRCETLPADGKVLRFAKRLFFSAYLDETGDDVQEDVRVLMAKAKIQEKKKDLASAIKIYQVILERCTTCLAARFRLGILLSEHGAIGRAKQLLDEGQERSLFILRWKKAKKARNNHEKNDKCPLD